jgi:hypothetical protein
MKLVMYAPHFLTPKEINSHDGFDIQLFSEVYITLKIFCFFSKIIMLHAIGGRTSDQKLSSF